jgi:glycosyltransferase involved in cell wall biosynthesis
LQPTRIVQRKGIQRAIELLARLREDFGLDGVLVISGPVDSREEAYAHWVFQEAPRRQVPLIHAVDSIDLDRRTINGQKIYCIADAYVHADLITFPSDLEGFGNPVVEAAMYRKPLFVNRYPVLADIMELVEGTERNFRIAKTHFSYERLRERLVKTLQDLSKIIRPTESG